MRIRSFAARYFVSVAFTAVCAEAIVIPSLGVGAGSSPNTNIYGQDTNAADYLSPYGTVFNGVNMNGVVLVSFTNAGGDTAGCSGALISADQILTAGHCVIGGTGTVSFVGPNSNYNAATPSSTYTNIAVSSYIVDPLYTQGGDVSTQGNDLAVLTLATDAPSYATVYSLYTGITPFNTDVSIVGFGYTGTGTTGGISYDKIRREGQNVYDTTGAVLGYSSNLLVGDFDSGAAANNARGTTDSSIANEVDFGFGDSGGPTFYNGQIIEVHDLIICATDANGNCTGTSYGSANNSYYGQSFADTSVSAAANLSFIQAQTAPEPATWCLFGTALLGFALFRKGRFGPEAR